MPSWLSRRFKTANFGPAYWPSALLEARATTPDGWREAIGPYAEPGSFRSVADVVDPDSLQKVRDFKKAAKAKAKANT